MVQLQILNKVLASKNTEIITKNDLTKDYFEEYPEEYDYILDHVEQYGNTPDIETFISNFNDFDVIDVRESDEYLLNTIQEEHLYQVSVPILTRLADLLRVDANKAIEYLAENENLLKNANTQRDGVDIIASAKDRYEEWAESAKKEKAPFIKTGFEELDRRIIGLHRGEELFVLFARSGNGKTWVTIKMLENAWRNGERVGMIEPEMSYNRVGYRFDTLHKGISAKALYSGSEIKGYDKYIDRLSQNTNPFIVARPSDFRDGQVTVPRLKRFVERNQLDILAIDGITYMTDSRSKRGTTKNEALTNISEDLMQMSIDLQIPIIIVVQSNRAVEKGEDLSLSNIRDSDGIAHNASAVFSIMQKEEGLQIMSNKVRNASNDIKLLYQWDADTGNFTYIESGDSDNSRRSAKEQKDEY